jgi:hypothetical protein
VEKGRDNRPPPPTLAINSEALQMLDLDFERDEKAEALSFLAQFSKDCGHFDVATDYCNRLLDFGYQEVIFL